MAYTKIPLIKGAHTVSLKKVSIPSPPMSIRCCLCGTMGSIARTGFTLKDVRGKEVYRSGRFYCSEECAEDYTAMATLFYLERGIEVEVL